VTRLSAYFGKHNLSIKNHPSRQSTQLIHRPRAGSGPHWQLYPWPCPVHCQLPLPLAPVGLVPLANGPGRLETGGLAPSVGFSPPFSSSRTNGDKPTAGETVISPDFALFRTQPPPGLFSMVLAMARGPVGVLRSRRRRALGLQVTLRAGWHGAPWPRIGRPAAPIGPGDLRLECWAQVRQ
jgi:hypothetical protein